MIKIFSKHKILWASGAILLLLACSFSIYVANINVNDSNQISTSDQALIDLLTNEEKGDEADIVVGDYVPPSAFWSPLPGGENEQAVIADSELISKGIVIEQRLESRGGEGNRSAAVEITISKVRIDEVYAIQKGGTLDSATVTKKDDLIIEVLQTGSYITGKGVIGDAPLLELNKTYVLFLSDEVDGIYAPVAGRYGIAEVDSDGTIHFTNELAENMMDNFEGEVLENIEEDISQIAEETDTEFDIAPEIRVNKGKVIYKRHK
jgi:hypothetical protein